MNRVLYVPPLYETLTRRHLREVAAEGRFLPRPAPPARHNLHWALGALSLLMLWHGVTRGWWTASAFSPAQWAEFGALDVDKTLHGEWFRTITALTLHTDSEHLFSNMLFGAPFFLLLCRRVGLGPGLSLAVLAGGLGNLGNALYRQTAHISLGFSTALFGIVGVYTALLAAEELRHIARLGLAEPRLALAGLRRAFVFLAAGVAVLAMLGADPAARTDYAAHIFGLLAGLLVGGGAGAARAFLPPLSKGMEAACGLLTLGLLATAWLLALGAV